MEDLEKSFSVTPQLNGGAPRNTTTVEHGVEPGIWMVVVP